MIPNSVAYDYNTLHVTTMRHVGKKLADAIFLANPTTAYMLNNGRINFASGGSWIEEKILYNKNTNTRGYTGYEPITVSPSEELTKARFQWRQTATGITVSGLEKDIQNAGPEQMMDMVRTKVIVCEKSIREYFNEQIFLPTASKDMQRDFLGLQQLVEADIGSNQSTVGGINRQTYAFWQNKFIKPLAPAAVVTFSDGYFSEQMLRFRNTVQEQIDKSRIIITSRKWFENFELEQLPFRRYDAAKSTITYGHETQLFKGIPMMWDAHCPDDLVYFLNLDHLGFRIHRARNFRQTGLIDLLMYGGQQDACVQYILVAGNMTVENSRYCGVMDMSLVSASSNYPG